MYFALSLHRLEIKREMGEGGVSGVGYLTFCSERIFFLLVSFFKMCVCTKGAFIVQVFFLVIFFILFGFSVPPSADERSGIFALSSPLFVFFYLQKSLSVNRLGPHSALWPSWVSVVMFVCCAFFFIPTKLDLKGEK